jgi:four helix bundle protein
MKVADYKDLRVYHLAFESAMEIFELSRRWPSEEKFSLIDQIRRSSRSVCTNMAEAWRKRRYEAAFISKLSDSDGEAAESEVHLAFALRCGYLAADKQAKLLDQYDHICRQLTRMMNDASSWCGTGCELREVPLEYVVGGEGRGEREERGERGERREREERKERGSVQDALSRSNAPRSTLRRS